MNGQSSQLVVVNDSRRAEKNHKIKPVALSDLANERVFPWGEQQPNSQNYAKKHNQLRRKQTKQKHSDWTVLTPSVPRPVA